VICLVIGGQGSGACERTVVHDLLLCGDLLGAGERTSGLKPAPLLALTARLKPCPSRTIHEIGLDTRTSESERWLLATDH